MFGAIIVSVFAASLVASYMIIVNRFLRLDEHYHSPSDHAEPQQVQNRRAGFMSHAQV